MSKQTKKTSKPDNKKRATATSSELSAPKNAPASPPKKSPFRIIFSIITLVFVAIIVWNARGEIVQAFDYLKSANIWWILLLIPEQLFMYFCAGQIVFSYMRNRRQFKHASNWELLRMSLELNFINHAIPSSGFSGLGYMIWRLRPFGVTAGQASFVYALRFVIMLCANQLQTIVAVIFLALSGNIHDGSEWIVVLTFLLSAGTLAAIFTIIYIATSRARIERFARFFSRAVNAIVRKVTFGKHQNVLAFESVHKFFDDWHDDLIVAKRHRRSLLRPILWGCLYSFFEVAIFWVVSISMGNAKILPQIMVGEALASVIGGILPTPGGVGGYEGAMIFVMSLLGVEVGLATAVVITTRVLFLLGTIASGYGFYQYALAHAATPFDIKNPPNQDD